MRFTSIYANLVQLHTFTVLRQNALTFILPPPYARFMSAALMRASVQCHVLVRATLSVGEGDHVYNLRVPGNDVLYERNADTHTAGRSTCTTA